VLGSIANLIVVQTAAASGVTISYWDYFRVGAPLTIVTHAIGTELRPPPVTSTA
jgi:Na+/H+ antiporter NhaD/arsenite permease-like protein